jgi:DNA integrity scanning protein DisA with diadenylate cyclase activity
MALQLGALRDALLDAGAKPEKADKAAEELAGYEHEFAEIKSDLRVLKWSQAATLAGVVAILIKLFVH